MRIFKSSIAKKILGIVVIMGCSGIFLNGYVGMGESVHAQAITSLGTPTPASGSSIDTMGLRQILNMVLKLIYLLLRPLLVVAGLALDNTLVYASIFHLDAPLRKFRNMMKNFANFTLGFMVLFAIIKNFFVVKDEKGPIDIIKKTLIAGVLIQASWFLMAALVDVSTIATYAVGGLPLSVLRNTTIGTQKILSVNSQIDLNKFDILNKSGGFNIWYSTVYKGQPLKLSPCRVVDSFVIGREFGGMEYKNSEKIQADYSGYEVCVYGNQLVMRKEDAFMTDICNNSPNKTCYNWTDELGYTSTMDTLINITGWQNQSRVTGSIVNLASTSSPVSKDGLSKGSDLFAGSTSMTISDLITKSKGFVGPLVTMYSSLLNFAQLTDTNVTTNGETTGIFIIKSLFAIALFFPLLALAVVLIARIGVLRLYIVASPFIAIKASFKDFKLSKKLDEYLDIKNIIGIIFAPVVTVAALSISIIFMTVLTNGFKSSGSSDQIRQAMGVQTVTSLDKKNDAVSFGGITTVEFTKFAGEAGDRFSRFLINFFGIGLMWMIFFAALKASSLGKSIGEPIQSFGQKFFTTLPIIPYGSEGKMAGIGTIAQGFGGLPEKMEYKLQSKESEQLEKWRTGGGEEGTGTPLTKATAIPIVTAFGTLPTATTAAEAEKILTEKGITAPKENITANEQAYYQAIKSITNEEERQKAITGIGLIKGDTDWFKNMTKADAATKIDTDIITKSITEKTPEIDIKTLLDVAENKKILKEYFDNASETTYTKEIGDKTLTITKTTINNVETYTPTFELTKK